MDFGGKPLVFYAHCLGARFLFSRLCSKLFLALRGIVSPSVIFCSLCR
ncbi:hypothetical protein TSMEX_004122 [Taenia solium]|eukprot:TsM_000753800 transcript=TsM_000753800 gene=TsM_000753800